MLEGAGHAGRGLEEHSRTHGTVMRQRVCQQNRFNNRVTLGALMAVSQYFATPPGSHKAILEQKL
jgi:hypothetical protein